MYTCCGFLLHEERLSRHTAAMIRGPYDDAAVHRPAPRPPRFFFLLEGATYMQELAPFFVNFLRTFVARVTIMVRPSAVSFLH
jgi:hypothetical protein